MRTSNSPLTFSEFFARKRQAIEAEAAKLPEGPKRQALLIKILEADNAAHAAGWLEADLKAPD